ncbi:hypothetical protein ALQ33_200179 [Pseudomonas syringae pv. philadelphi]|uniref:Uncharacterized protein n=1 Tax=Pseudomonas syringae pv. philadelphi TaxID=251706 RepID=A0A3M3YC67_9PSED|nr:hypothetical protein ALQ33_200179 [Pseudomonas syringae pv. philadelphi]
MRAIRLFRVAGNQSVLVLDLPRRKGLSEACVVVKSAVRSRVHHQYFNDSESCSGFVQSFSQRNASYAVAGLLAQKDVAGAQ